MEKGKQKRRWFGGMDDDHWNMIVALARRRGMTNGQYLSHIAEQEWARETGQKEETKQET